MAEGASEYLRSVVQRNRGGGTVGSYAVCSEHPAVIHATIQQALEDGTFLHVESTSSQGNQFGGYTQHDLTGCRLTVDSEPEQGVGHHT
ncbi:MAG: class II D-tagatose-bisphosphate aldolase, non-catalytic subunit [Terriglobales bacterium]